MSHRAVDAVVGGNRHPLKRVVAGGIVEVDAVAVGAED